MVSFFFCVGDTYKKNYLICKYIYSIGICSILIQTPKKHILIIQ